MTPLPPPTLFPALLVGAGSAAKENKINRKNVRNIVATWFWSPVLGITTAAAASVILRAIFDGG